MKDLAPASRDESPRLMHRSQRLGIIPTWSFWQDPAVRANPIVAKLIVPAQAGLGFSTFTVWGIFGHPWLRATLPGAGLLGRMLISALLGGALAVACQCATFGVAERLLRKRILANRRRAEVLATADPSLPRLGGNSPQD